MNLLELFAGTKSISKIAQKKGWSTFTSDIDSKFNTDYTIDILNFDVRKVPFIPDVIWASPPCESYSLAAISYHRKKLLPISDVAKKADIVIIRMQKIIKYFQIKNPKLLFYIENPRACLRKMPFMKTGLVLFSENIIELPLRKTVTYCQYGDTCMKPTDIFTNNFKWLPRKMCKKGSPCHESAARGTNKGTQNKSNNIERAKLPFELCKEIIDSST